MTSRSSATGGATPQRPSASPDDALTPREVASRLKVSLSWLAKARMRGDGPPYFSVGRAIRYSEAALINWMRSRQRFRPAGESVRQKAMARPYIPVTRSIH